MGTAYCRSCDAHITWATTAHGKAMPIEPAPGGNIRLETNILGETVAQVVPDGTGTHVSHFARCPHAHLHRQHRPAS